MLNARLHTGGHLIAALLQEFFPGLQATNAHHWPNEARVKFMGELPKPEEVREILPEQLSSAIAGDLPVTITGDPDQNRGIMIGEYPSVPCGGTHVEQLSFLKQVEINKVKVKKDRLRVSYSIAD
jgi:Ser-tRNA(Ala) deacylase AlaX